MRKIYNFIIVTLTFVTINVKLNAQQYITCAKVNESESTNLNTRFRAYQLFNISTNEVNNAVSHTNNSLSNLKLSFPNFMNMDLSLVADNILSENYTLVVNDGITKTTSTINECITFTGKLYTDVNSVVTLTITNDFFYGMIRTKGKEYYIEPLHYFKANANQNVYVVYEKNDVVIDPNLTCAVTEAQLQANNYRPTAGTGCVIADVAIASDATMIARYGTAAAVQNHNIGVLNNVKVDYLNNAFTQNIEFKIFTQYVSTAAAADPTTPLYAGTNSGTILNNFRTWGEGNGSTGGFGSVFSYDIGSLWTTKDIDNDGLGGGNGTIGLAYVGGYCGGSQYQILEDFTGSNPTGSGFQLRVLTSHETGHNFNMSHDGAGTPFIMAPSVQNTSTWSATSATSLNNHILATGSCNNTCVVGLPVTDFFTSSTVICTGSTLTLTDFTYGGPTTWSWSMPGGTPATSTSRNPTVSYATAGVKAITLTATNSNGSVVKRKVILVETAPIAACAISGTNTNGAGISSFTLQNISNPTLLPPNQAGAVYTDYSCSKIASLNTNTSYSGSVTVGTQTPANAFNSQDIYIDYNNNGVFTDANELVFTSGGGANIGTVPFSFTTPASGVTLNKLLRMRVVGRSFNGVTAVSATSCPSGTTQMEGAEVEDYAVSFPLILPLSDLAFNGILNTNKKAYLQWSVQNFGNYKTTELERSEDGIQFRSIHQNIVNTTNFNYTDPLSINGVAYYRLKITYLNGNIFYSNIVKLSSNNKLKFVQNVLPNPFTNTIQFNVYNEVAKKLNVQIYDNTGRKVHEENTNVNAGIQLFEINNLEKLSKGMYMLVIQNGNESYTEKLIKQ